MILFPFCIIPESGKLNILLFLSPGSFRTARIISSSACGNRELPQSKTGAIVSPSVLLLYRKPQFPLCLSQLPIRASTMNISQKCLLSSSGSIACCSSIAASISDSSVPYPLCSESIIVFLSDAKSCSTVPSEVKSLHATTSLSLLFLVNVPRIVFCAGIPTISKMCEPRYSDTQLFA